MAALAAAPNLSERANIEAVAIHAANDLLIWMDGVATLRENQVLSGLTKRCSNTSLPHWLPGRSSAQVKP